MIDKKTGYIILSESRTIKAGGTIDSIAAVLPDVVLPVRDRQTGWQWVTVRNLYLEGSYFILSFGFYTNALKQIELIISDDKFELSPSWEKWSEKSELDILTKLRIWLKKELGREGAFDWGEVRANYDRKGGSSSITIRYK